MKKHPSIVVLTGAGISAESGVATFRGVDGLWEGHDITEVASPQGFRTSPALVHRFYNMRRAAVKTVQPNAGHDALVKLEREWPGEFLLVTQNVDDLHERAGSEKLLHMHGELKKVRCSSCDSVFSWEDDLSTETPCPNCRQTGGMRPDIVWFGEIPMHMEEISATLEETDIFISIGTSGVVYPAAGFVELARRAGATRRIEVNLEATDVSGRFNEHRIGPASVEVVKLVDELLSGAATAR